MHSFASVVRPFLAAVTLSSLLAGCAAGGGIKDSDPHLQGPRDMNYDHLIVPGERIGPASLNGKVSYAVQHLGEPDNVSRSTYRGPGYDADEVYYRYADECIQFTWQDSGVDPTIENGWRGIIVTCDKWKTPTGLHVGSTVQEVVAQLGDYCPTTRDDGSLLIATKSGIWYEAQDRNSPISAIVVVPTASNWGGMCKD
jgi:hypothetical protein